MNWSVHYFQEDDGSIPAATFEDSLDRPLAAKLRTFVQVVTERKWSLGGGIFEACHSYPDIFEIRAKRGRDLARMFCSVDNGRLILLDGILKAEGEPTPPQAFAKASELLSRFRKTGRTV